MPLRTALNRLATLCALLCFVGLSVPLPAQTTPRKADAASALQSRLHSDPVLKRFSITARVRNHALVLTGNVPLKSQKARAGRLARRFAAELKDVRFVVKNLVRVAAAPTAMHHPRHHTRGGMHSMPSSVDRTPEPKGEQP